MTDGYAADRDVLAPSGRVLLERADELGAMRAALTAASAGAGSLVVVAGPAGIGKSRLLSELRATAAAAGFTVLSARATEFERDYPFGVVRQLFDPVARRAESGLFDGPARGAAALFGVDADAAGPGQGDATFAALHGLYWLTVNVSAGGPVLLVVDDLQWCDRPSLRFLAHLAPRLDGLPVLLVAGLRPDGANTEEAMLGTLGGGAVDLIHPRLLSEHAVARLAGSELGAEPDASFAAACHRATAGNPLLVTELLRALRAERVQPDAEHVGAVSTLGPQAVSRAVLMRLARLSAEATEAALSLAILGDGAELPAVAALAGQDEPTLSRAVNELVRAEILRPELSLGFNHPLVGDAIYHHLTPGDRQLRHARAAQLLRGTGAPAERVATQVLALEPQRQPWVVDVLREAARAALHAGAADSAVAYLRRAEREPPTPQQRPELLRDLGIAEALVAAPAAVEHLGAAYASLGDADERPAIADLLARLMLFTGSAQESADMAHRGALETPADQIDQRRGLLALELYAVHFGAPDTRTAARLVEALEGLDDSGPGSRALYAVAAWDRAATGGTLAESVELARTALSGGVLIRTDPALMSLIAASVLILAEADDAVTACEEMLASARRQGSMFAIAGVHQCQGSQWLARGELLEAEDCLRQAIAEQASLYESAWSAATPSVAAFLTHVLIERGDITGARRTIATAGAPQPGSTADALCRHARIAVLLAEEKWQQAADAADAFAAVTPRIVNPSLAPWRSLKARALVHLNRRVAAAELLEAELEHARVWNAPGILGPALRRLGALRGAGGLALLREAVAVTDGTSARLEHARSLIALGSGLRGADRPGEARTHLREAHALATDCAATPLVDRAVAELAAAGGRPRARREAGPAALTPSERRVAERAAAGHSNRSIAQSLYVTPKTVEIHLSNTYRKLGIHSRTELAGVLAART